MPERNQPILCICAACLAAFLLTLFPAAPAHALAIHQEIKGLFRQSRDVTVKCMECHKQKAEEVLHGSHWSWKRPRIINGKQVLYGKRDSLSAFAIDAVSNPARCLVCHVSNSTGPIDFDNGGPDMVDCLVCHDTTGLYSKKSEGLHEPATDKFDLLELARNVGIPSPGNCTGCHFADCGLPQSNPKTSPDQGDVHMRGGLTAFTCQACHRSDSGHSFAGKTFRSDKEAATVSGCAACHSETPHRLATLNRHGSAIACRTCHIPIYATVRPVLVEWNWLLTDKSAPVYSEGSAGRYRVHDQNGIWMATNMEPLYFWDYGGDDVYTRGERIDPQEMTVLQAPGRRSPSSKIAPFRPLYATQLYDTKYRYLISPLLSTRGNTLFSGSDWDTPAREGMKAIILPYSGQIGFAPTVSYRRINHGVVPAEKALDCLDCHGRTGRLPWARLGYDEDPLTQNAAIPPGSSESLGGEPGKKYQEKSEPVRETFIPGGPGF